jgi:urease accessory protein
MAPQVPGGVGWLVMGALGGGLLGGDHIAMEILLESHARAYLTTQGATKVYRSGTAGPARQEMKIRIEPHAVLLLAPDPVVCFEQSSYQQEQEFNIDHDGSMLAVDWFTSGRWLRGERWGFTRYQSRQRFYVNGQPVLIDAIDLNNTMRRVSAATGMEHINAMATVVCLGPVFGPAAAELLAALHEVPVNSGDRIMFGASELADGLILRVAGESMEGVGRFLRTQLASAARTMNIDMWSRKW